MTSRPELSLASTLRLETGWRLTLTPAGAHASPATLPDDAIAAFVPGTVAEALEKASCLIGPIPFRSIIRISGIGLIE